MPGRESPAGVECVSVTKYDVKSACPSHALNYGSWTSSRRAHKGRDALSCDVILTAVGKPAALFVLPCRHTERAWSNEPKVRECSVELMGVVP